MRRALELAAVFMLIAIAIFFIVLTLFVNSISRELLSAIESVHRTAEATTAAAAELQPTIVDLRRTILIAGGTLNLARDTLRNEQKTIRAANEKTIETMKNVDELLAGADQSQRSIAAHADATLAALDPVMIQMRADLAALEPVITAAKPLLDNSAATMANANRISADLAKVTDDAVKPKPWYKRIAGYIWAPVKLAAIFAK